ncbi:MAG: NPCBM/NEW2 domain-containing protein [Planctomycetes bacterium]|nr:NPCBM/NEW2 domain-containing protein [Planctomycetota bacterium]
MPRVLPAILILLLASLVNATPTLAVSPRIVVTFIDGQQVEGELVDWQADTLSLTSEDGSTEVPLNRLLSVRPVETAAIFRRVASYVELTDGSLLPLSGFTVVNRVATIHTMLAEQPLRIPTAQIQLVQFSGRAQSDAAFWAELAEKQLPGDVLVIQKGEPVQLDYLSGVLGDVSEELVDFRWDGEEIPVKRTKIAALVYYHSKQPKLPEPRCWITTRHGARIPAARVKWKTEEEVLLVTTVTGLKFAVPLTDLHEADYSVGKLAYLSDLTPLRQQWTPRIGLPVAAELIRQHGLPRRDQSFSGSSLTLLWPAENSAGSNETKSYAKGLALRSRTLLEYRIPSGMIRFAALVGIDPTTASQGKVTLEISADGNLLWQGEIEGGSAPVEINVPLPKARRLRLFVDYGTNLDYGDRLHLVDARLTK